MNSNTFLQMKHKLNFTKNIMFMIVLFSNSFVFGQEDYKVFSKNTMQGTLYGVKNVQTNTEIIPPIYLQIVKQSLDEDKFTAQKGDFLGVIDTSHKTIIPFEYNYISDYVEGRAFVSKKDKFAVIDEKGKLLTQFLYEDFLEFNDGVAGISINGKAGYIDKNGKTILPAKFDEGEPCVGKFIVVYSKKWDSYGYEVVTYNLSGKEIQRQDVGSYGKYALVFNTDGKLIYRGESDEKIVVLPTKNTFLARYYKAGNSRYTIVNYKGEILNQFYEYPEIKDNWIEVSFYDAGKERRGILDFNGKVLLPTNFKFISGCKYDNNTLARVEFFDGQYFFINKDGKCVEFDNQICPE